MTSEPLLRARYWADQWEKGGYHTLADVILGACEEERRLAITAALNVVLKAETKLNEIRYEGYDDE